MMSHTVYHIPVCPFCQRLEILLSLKGKRNAVGFHVIDITQPRPDWLLAKTQGSTALPVMETEDGKILKLYYDYAKGAGNGALLPGRKKSSFSFEPDWRARPWPPQNKYEHSATDQALGLMQDVPRRRAQQITPSDTDTSSG